MTHTRHHEATNGRKAAQNLLICAAIVLCCSAPVNAQSFIWVGPGGTPASPTTGNWNDAGHWSPGLPPDLTSAQLTFGGSGASSYTSSQDFGATRIVGRMIFNSTSTAQNTLDGGVIQLGGTPQLVAAGSGSFDVQNEIQLNANGTLTGNGTGVIVLSGGISETGGSRNLVKTGSSTFEVGTSSYTGTTTVNNGTLRLGGNDVLSPALTTVLANGSGLTATLDLNGKADTIGALTLGGAGATTSSQHRVIDSAGGGVLTLGGNVTYTSTGHETTSALISGNLNLGGANRTFSIADSVGNNLTHNVDLHISGDISGGETEGVIKTGAGNLHLSGNNTFGGTVHVQVGTLSISTVKDGGVASNLGMGTSPIIIGNGDAGATLQILGAGGATNRQVQIGADNPAASSNQRGGATIVNNGSGALEFTNEFFNSVANTGTGTAANGTRLLTLSGSNTGDNIIHGVIRDNVRGDGTLASPVNVVKTGTGSWTLAGENTYTGTTTINNGVLKLGDDNVLPGTAVTVNANGLGQTATLDINGKTDTIGGLTLGGAGATTSSVHQVIDSAGGGLLTLGGSVTYTVTGNPTASALIGSNLSLGASARTFTINDSTGAAVDLKVTGDISATAAVGITKAGLGALELAGTNSYTGTTLLSAGTLILSGTKIGEGAMTANRGLLLLDYGANNTSKLSDGSRLTLGGATLELSGGSHVEVVGDTALTALTSTTITRSSGTSTLQLGNISHSVTSTAALHFGQEGIATTTRANNAGGILGGWATVGTDGGGVDWATRGAGDSIVAFSGYTDIDRLGGAIANGDTVTYRISNGGVEGDITLSGGAGTININALKMDATDGPATVSISPGQILRLRPDGGILMDVDAGPLTITGGELTAGAGTSTGGTLVLSNHSLANALSIESVIRNNPNSGAVALTKSGPGEVVLSGANTYTGATFVAGGTLTIASDTALGAVGGATTVWLGSTLQLQGDITVGAEALTLRGTGVNGNGALVNASGDNSWGGLITVSEAGSIISNAGTLTIERTGQTAITATAATTLGGPGNIVVNGNITASSTTTLNGAGSISVNGNITGNGLLILGGSGNIDITGNLTRTTGATVFEGSGSITLTGDFTARSSGALTFGGSGDITVNGNIAGTTGVTTFGGSGDITVNGNLTGTTGVTTFDGSGTTTINGNLATTSGTLNFRGTGSTTLNGDINATSAALVKSGAGTFTLNGDRNGTGATTINNGTLRLGGDSTFGTGLVTVNANGPGQTATLDLNGNNLTLGAGLTLGGAGATASSVHQVIGTGELTLGGNVTYTSTGNETTSALISANLNLGAVNRTFSIADSTGNNLTHNIDLEVSGSVSGTGGITKTGAGNLYLSHDANAFSGPVHIQAGTLSIDTLGAIVDGEFQSSLGTDSSPIIIGNTSVTGTLRILGNGGETDRQVQIGNGAGTNAGGAIILNDGAGAIAFTNATFNASDPSVLTTAARILTLGGSNTGDNTIVGVIQNNTGGTNSVAVVKTGSGKWILEGENTYSGATTVNDGTLVLTGSLGNGAVKTGAIVVNGGTLIVESGNSQNTGAKTVNGTVIVKNQAADVGQGPLGASGALTISSANSTSGLLHLSDQGSLVNSAGGANLYAVTINAGGTLRFDNVAANTAGPGGQGRWHDTAALALTRGTLELWGNAAGSTEVMGNLTATQQARVSFNTQAGGEAAGTTTLEVGTLTRTGTSTTSASGLLIATREAGSFGVTDVLVARGQPALFTGGIINPGIINATDHSFVSFDSVDGKFVLRNATYTSTDLNTAGAASVVDVTAATALTSTQVAALRTNSNISGVGETLTIHSLTGSTGAAGAIFYGGSTEHSANFAFGTGASGIREAVVYVGNGSDATITGDVSVAGAAATRYFTKMGDGQLTISGGYMDLGTTNVIGGKMTFDGDGTVVNGRINALGGHVVFEGGAQITGNSAMTSLGGGILEINTANGGYSGVVTIGGTGAGVGNRAILLLGDGQALGTGALTMSTGSYLGTSSSSIDLVGANAITNNVALAAVSTFGGVNNGIASGSLEFQGNVLSSTGNRTIVVDQGAAGATVTFSGDILSSTGTSSRNVILSGTGHGIISGVIQNHIGATSANATALTKTGNGTWTLSGMNEYEGATTVTSGTLIIGADALAGRAGALGNGASTVAVGGALDASLLIGGAFEVGRNLSLTSGVGVTTIGGNTADTSVFSGTVTLLKSVNVTAALGGDVQFTGQITGSFGITKVGEGTVTYAEGGVFNYTLATNVNEGVLKVASNFVGGGAFEVNSGGTLQFANGGQLSSNSLINVHSGGTLRVDDGSKLLGTGLITVNDAGALSVSGNGLAAKTVLINDGGLLSVGNSPGFADMGTMTFNAGASFLFEIDDAAGIAGTNWDLVSYDNLTINATAANPMIIELVSWSGDILNFDPNQDYSWLFFTSDTPIIYGAGGFDPSLFLVDASGFTNSIDNIHGTGIFSVFGDSNNLYLQFTAAVPEPSSWLLLSFGAAGLLGHHRRRRRRQPRAAAETATHLSDT